MYFSIQVNAQNPLREFLDETTRTIEIRRSTTLVHDTLDWEKDPVLTELPDSLADEPEVVVSDKLYHVYSYFGADLFKHTTVHKKIRVNSDDAIQSNNKVYIPLAISYGIYGIIDARARVITPSGEVIKFDSTNIQYSEGGEDRPEHKYFAIDGVENGSDIEYIYTILSYEFPTGTFVSLQENIIKRNTEFVLACPHDLVFAFKSYNNCPEAVEDTLYADSSFNVYRVGADVFPKLLEEEYSSYQLEVQKVAYKLDKVKSTGKNNLISFDNVTVNYYKSLTDLSKKDKKLVSKYIKSSGASKTTDKEEQIKLFESYIKQNTLQLGGNASSISKMSKDGYMNSEGRMKIFIEALDQLAIDFQIILTSDNDDAVFDVDFQHMGVLRNAFIYLPEYDRYICPDMDHLRYGFAPYHWTNQDGLFITPLKIGELNSAIGEIDFVPSVESSFSKDLIEIDVNLEDITSPILDIHRELYGYHAQEYQGYYKDFDSEDQEEVDLEYITFPDVNATVLSYEVTGFESEDIGVNPVVYDAKIESTTLIEKAREQYIFNVGKIIGEQIYLKDSLERQTNINIAFNSQQNKKITITIPEGYEASGMEGLNTEAKFELNGKTTFFRSSYKVIGNKIEITIEEEYNHVYLDKSYFPEFKNVVNTASNFNNVSIFITKL